VAEIVIPLAAPDRRLEPKVQRLDEPTEVRSDAALESTVVRDRCAARALDGMLEQRRS
jgi:hypothetical protein